MRTNEPKTFRFLCANLKCRRILGRRKLLVYVRTVVTAADLCYDGGRLGRVEVVTLRVGPFDSPIFSLLFEFENGAFASKTFPRPKKTPALQAIFARASFTLKPIVILTSL